MNGFKVKDLFGNFVFWSDWRKDTKGLEVFFSKTVGAVLF